MEWVETLQRASVATLRNAFLLAKAEQTAASYPVDARARLLELFRAGRRRAELAADFLDHQPAAARVVFAEAAILYIGAILASRGRDVELAAGDVKRAFDELDAVRADMESPPAGFEQARQLLTTDDLLAIDRMPESDASASLAAVASTVRWLGQAIEARTVKQIKMSRVVRLGIAALAVLAALIWAVGLVFSAPNIALHKTVVVSSVHPSSTAVLGGLTDGITSGAYGVHTNREDDPWVNVDLQDVYRLNKIKLYNRGDGWFDDALPLTLELSENGTDFAPVDKRTTSFGQWSPWVYSAGGKKARYIRVHGVKGGFVSLSELEAFGKK